MFNGDGWPNMKKGEAVDEDESLVEVEIEVVRVGVSEVGKPV